MHLYIIICYTGIHGGIRFDLPDDLFSRQPALAYLPKSLTAPIEGKHVYVYVLSCVKICVYIIHLAYVLQ